ncbi:hypothetical protein GCM10025883_41400 [Mobilicoccus caccae]|uniref:NADP-dependent oxidoreductase domain-containing protein n=1 Tax=Mobilicoccus caccae TaxID=1859295 RepID=A0ABQ6IVY2_9MICO|nr:hypothetical protein GCM10025883_41400 [Mobilicoccus caccae]
MAQGVLSGKYEPGQAPKEGTRAAHEEAGGSMGDFMNERVLTAVQELKPIAADAGLSMPALAIAWVLQNDNVAAALVGASRPEQLEENVKAVGVKLEESIMQRIDAALSGVSERDPGKTAERAPKTRVC